LLNAGLGRFGMKINPYISEITTSKAVKEILSKYKVINNIPLFEINNEIMEYIKYDPYNLILDDNSVDDVDHSIINNYKQLLDLDQSLPVAIAVNSYARIVINKFLIQYKKNVYMSDTA
jgi:hypothetical protein